MIKGAVKTLRTNKVNLAIATYHELNGEKTFMMVEDLLKNLGYSATTEFEEHLTTYAKN